MVNGQPPSALCPFALCYLHGHHKPTNARRIMRYIDQMITEQVQTWAQHEAEAKRRGEALGSWPIITISREFGARGAALSKILSERTGFEVWDKDLIRAVADERGGDMRVVKTLDEHRQKGIADAVRGALTGQHTNLDYVRSLMRVVHTLAVHGGFIVVGRGANFICKPAEAFRVRVVCPLEKRIQGYAQREGLDLRQARKIIEKRDAERAEFIRRTFRKDLAAPSNYDLVLNSGTYTLDELADLVLVSYQAKTGQRLPEASVMT